MTKQELVDVLDKNGQPTGRKATIDEVCDQGYWHNSVHAIIITEDNRIVAQKRSRDIIMNPNLIELSAGGIVSAGEKPEQAIRREVKEELGIGVAEREVILINTRTYNKHYPRLNKTAKTFLHTYVIKLREPITHTHLQSSESAQIYFLTLRNAKRLVKLHRLVRVGRITPFYTYWKFSLNGAIKYINPIVHFVCRGNTFRSRLAEAYFNEIKSNRIKVISSGIQASENQNGNISYLGRYILNKHHYKNYKKSWTQTTQNNIDASTIVVFVSPTVLADAQKMFDLSATKYLVWSIPDINQGEYANSEAKAEEVYQMLVNNIKKLKDKKEFKYILL